MTRGVVLCVSFPSPLAYKDILEDLMVCPTLNKEIVPDGNGPFKNSSVCLNSPDFLSMNKFKVPLFVIDGGVFAYKGMLLVESCNSFLA